jgi:hypothetical protein
MLYLSPDIPTRALNAFLEEHCIKLYNLGFSAFREEKTWTPISDEIMKEALEIVLSQDSYPILLVCTSGVYELGVMVACLRRLQGWSLTSALEEYRLFAAGKARLSNEQFVEMFDIDLVTVPPVPCNWWKTMKAQDLEEAEEYENLMALPEAVRHNQPPHIRWITDDGQFMVPLLSKPTRIPKAWITEDDED